MKYPHIFSPLRLGNLNLKNRLVMSQMTMNYATEEGFVTDKLIRHYQERARGGVGLILVEGTFFTPEGRGYRNQLGISSGEHVQGLREMTASIHGAAEEVKVFLQIHHAGWRAASKLTGLRTVGPSALPPYPGAEEARALTVEEIRMLVTAHIEAAVRARDADFDGVDIHCAHGYLIPSFFSPLSNRRTDEYGRDLAGRTRFLVEIVKGIKARLGQGFPVTIKISGDEYIEGGLRVREMTEIARIAQEAGVDAIGISAGTVGGKKEEDLSQAHKALRTLPMMTRPGCLVPIAAEIKRALRVPVITVGRINTPDLAEEVVARGWADLVAMGRALLADPHLPVKALEGREVEIRPCLACNEGCYKRIFLQLDIQCSVNPTVGRDDLLTCERVSEPKNVAVVGAGPAGMEAAFAAWEKGHKVAVWEASPSMGGQLRLASVSPGREDIGRLRAFMEDRLTRAGVSVFSGRPANLSTLREFGPEVVILATGAEPRRIAVQGLDPGMMVTAWDVLAGRLDLEEPILILGGGLVGCEVADTLASRGKKVILAEVLSDIAAGGDTDTKTYFTLRFKQNRVEVLTGAELMEVDRGTAVFKLTDKEVRRRIGSVVCAVGAKSKEELFDELSPHFQVIKIGDCAQPGTILEAVQEGFRAGRSICNG